MRISLILIKLLLVVTINTLAGVPYPNITDEQWQKIKSHLVTDTHPAKKALDELFIEERYSVYDINQLKKKGFFTPRVKGLHVHTLFHKKIPGYLVKIYRYAYPGYTLTSNDWQSWLERIEGAELVRQAIKESKYSKYFVVPKKWIYALPPDTTRDDPINFILVVEDMNLVSKERNLKYYKREITKKHLRGAFEIVTKVGLSDGCSHNNLFWTKDKKLAFVDTESHHKWPVHYQRMLEYLDPTHRKWWNHYVKKKGFDPTY